MARPDQYRRRQRPIRPRTTPLPPSPTSPDPQPRAGTAPIVAPTPNSVDLDALTRLAAAEQAQQRAGDCAITRAGRAAIRANLRAAIEDQIDAHGDGSEQSVFSLHGPDWPGHRSCRPARESEPGAVATGSQLSTREEITGTRPGRYRSRF